MLYNFSKNKKSYNWDKYNLNGNPTAHLGGFLLIDSGNEDLSYLFRCQERYIPYASLNNIRCLLFSRNRQHTQQYLNRYIKLNETFQEIAKNINIEFPKIVEPAIVECVFQNDRLL